MTIHEDGRRSVFIDTGTHGVAVFRRVSLLGRPDAVNNTIRACWYGGERAEPTPLAPGTTDPAARWVGEALAQ